MIHKGSDQIEVGAKGQLGENVAEYVDHGLVVGSVAGDLGKALQNGFGVMLSAGAGNVNVIGTAHGTVGGKAHPSAVLKRLTKEVAGIAQTGLHLLLAVNGGVGVGGEIQKDHGVVVP